MSKFTIQQIIPLLENEGYITSLNTKLKKYLGIQNNITDPETLYDAYNDVIKTKGQERANIIFDPSTYRIAGEGFKSNQGGKRRISRKSRKSRKSKKSRKSRKSRK
jgi:hypothetical protein